MASLARTFDLSSIKAASVGGLVIKLLAVCFGQIPRQLNGHFAIMLRNFLSKFSNRSAGFRLVGANPG
jgi:hypothetical protein